MHQSELAGKLLSVQVAEPQQIGEGDEAWVTSFYKEPIASPVVVTETHIVGDRQADEKHHGGPDKAVLAYSVDHFDFWRQELATEVPYGGFGENLSIAGLEETTVCIGDRFAIGECEFEVSQPRQPCWKLGRRWNRSDLPKLVVKSGRSGWYLRIIRSGNLNVGEEVILLNRPRPNWTVQQASHVYYRGTSEQKQALGQVQQLAQVWKQELDVRR